MKRYLTYIFISLFIGKGCIVAQNDTLPQNEVDKVITKADSCFNERFKGWTEEQIKHWEDSVLAELYPLAWLEVADTSKKERSKTNNPETRVITQIDNPYVPCSVEVDTSKGVGEIPFTSGVSPTGAKTYTIPISVYPGMKGMQPDLSLTYNSHAGNSIVGMGWSISGLSCITRGEKSYYYDNKSEGIQMNMTDVFLLDGMHLIKLATYNSYALYESEIGNIKVKGYYSGAVLKYFEVFYPDGKKGVFGYTANTANKVMYPMTSLTDLKGNAITYNYGFYDNHYDITSISYNGASVDFQYQTARLDTILTYRGGLKMTEHRLLQSVTCKLGSAILGTYSLTYQANPYPSFLTQIDYTSNGQSLNPLRFFYGHGNSESFHDTLSVMLPIYYNFLLPSSIEAQTGTFDYGNDAPGLIVHQRQNPYWHYHRNYTADVFRNQYDELDESLKNIFIYTGLDSDYMTSYYALTMGTGFICVLCADLQGNQNENIIKINNTVVNNQDRVTFRVYEKYHYGLNERYSRTYDFPTVYTDDSGNKSVQPKFYYVGDFNGDGKMEILAVSVHQPFGQTAYPSKCYVFDLENNQILYQNHLFDYEKEFLGTLQNDQQIAENNSDKLLIMDVDADGKTDICHINTTNVATYSFQVSGSALTASQKGASTVLNRSMTSYRKVFSCELNGDSQNDIMVMGLNNIHGTAPAMYFYSKGDGLFDKKEVESVSLGDSEYDYFVQDVDGDGLTDIHGLLPHCFITTLGYYNIMYGGYTFGYTNNSALIPSAAFNTRHSVTRLLSLKGGILTKHLFKSRQRKYMMTGMANSLGIVEKTEYCRLDEDFTALSSYYSPVFPYSIIHEPLHVVARTELFMNGSCSDYNNYTYEYAVLHRQGLGFRGFKQMTRNNNRNQSFTTVFDPERFGVLTYELTPEREVDNTFSVNIASNKIAKIWLTDKVETDLLKRDTVTSSYTYDTYGYPLTENTSYSGGITVNTQNSYLSSTTVGTGYNLGYLNDQTVTKAKGNSTVVERLLIPTSSSRLPNVELHYINGNQVEYHVYSYDTHGNPLTDKKRLYSSSTDHTTTYTYDTYGRVTQVVDPLGLTTQYTYNNKGQRATMVDYRGNTTTYAYDAFGRETSVTYPASIVNATTYSWSSLGTNGLYAITKTETGKPTIRTVYDALNREVRVSDMRFDGNYRNVDKQYDNYGNLWKESLPFKGSTAAYWNTYTYDSHNRLLSLAEASGRTTTHSYNGNNVTTTEDNVTTTKTYDAMGHLVSVTDPAGTITYNLAADGQPTSIVAPGNVTTSFTYDNYRRRTAIADPSAGTTTYQYDAAGNISREINANGDSIQYTYDSHNRISWIRRPEFNTYRIYSNQNDLLVAWNSNGTQRTMTYDSYGRLATLKESVDSVWLQKTYTYANGNINQIRYESERGELMGEYFIYANGNVKEGRKNGTNLQFKLNSENALGQPTEIVTGDITRTYTYTPYGLPTGRTAASAAQTYQNFSYTFNAATSNLTSRTDNLNNQTENFTYDNLNRLKSAAGSVTFYDNKGNVTQKTDAGTFAYNITNKPYAISGVTNPQSLIVQRNQDISYTSFSRPDSIMENGYTAAFTYNSDGERVKMVLSQNGNVVSTKYYLGDCYERICTGTNVKERVYMFGNYYNATSVNQREGSSDNIFYLLRDHLGSVTNVIIAGDHQIQNVRYDAWGRLRNPYTGVLYTASNMPEIHFRGYTGHEHLKEFGLINMNARLYDPAIGRFLSPDPFVQMPQNSQNFNRYSYCLNNPLKYTDENGEFIFTALLGPFGAVLDGMCWGAVIGAGTAGISYTLSTWISGSQWRAGDFWKSVGMGAVGGAIGGGLGSIGQIPALSVWGNTMGYNMMSGISNIVATNVIFGNETHIEDIIPLVAGSLVGAKLPSFSAINGSSLKNCLAELAHNSVKGAITGCVSGLVSAQIHNDANRIWQNAIGGAIGGASRTMAMEVIFGIPYYTEDIYGTKGLYRSGGIASLITAPGNGLTMGQNMYIDTKHDQNTQYHENYHIQQQKQMGWARFYGIIATQYAQKLIQLKNPAGCEIERDAYEYGNTHAPY